ncbi:hypothetical protein [Pseudooceanicola sp. HF7]|uniref:hypothetical protein n=1 Tax=Pseudooceanicola sp. HF7 TaxID=2721560 RepID=UPI00142FC84F|nr:hypothetical protein [Pseudooceanicola sp. HF7]NIZ08560.1 hypothetical protein [Pseudooceanicola sp. HF7]
MSGFSSVEPELKKVERQLHRKFGHSRWGIDRLMRRAGRRLPTRAHKAAAEIQEARQMAHHPRLARVVDGERLKGSVRVLGDAVRDYDDKARRIDLLLSVLRALAFNLLVLGVIMLVLAHWRGLI